MILRPRGFLKLIVLKLLSEKPRHGYEIMDEIEKKIKWRPSAGAIYPKLQELEFEGLVEVTEEKIGDKSKKVYALTEKGKSELKQLNQTKTEVKNVINKWVDNAAELVSYLWPQKEIELVTKEINKLGTAALEVSKKNISKAVSIVKKAKEEINKL